MKGKFLYSVCACSVIASMAAAPACSAETTIDSNFSGDRLIAVIKEQYSSDIKIWEPEFFGIDGITKVEDLSYSPGKKVNNRQILLLKFAEDDKQQILDAVSEISKMEEVEYAGVNGISEYDRPEPIAPAMVYVDTDRIKYSIGDINNDEKVDVTDLSVTCTYRGKNSGKCKQISS